MKHFSALSSSPKRQGGGIHRQSIGSGHLSPKTLGAQPIGMASPNRAPQKAPQRTPQKAPQRTPQKASAASKPAASPRSPRSPHSPPPISPAPRHWLRPAGMRNQIGGGQVTAEITYMSDASTETDHAPPDKTLRRLSYTLDTYGGGGYGGDEDSAADGAANIDAGGVSGGDGGSSVDVDGGGGVGGAGRMTSGRRTPGRRSPGGRKSPRTRPNTPTYTPMARAIVPVKDTVSTLPLLQRTIVNQQRTEALQAYYEKHAPHLNAKAVLATFKGELGWGGGC